ncbi:MAG TPA: hypothetical protein V6C97_19120 [Oculatellaceae cyanobacterium]
MDDSEVPSGLTKLWVVLALKTEEGGRSRIVQYGPLDNIEEATKLAKGRGRDGADAKINEGLYVIINGLAYPVSPCTASIPVGSAINAVILHTWYELLPEERDLDPRKLRPLLFNKLSPADQEELLTASGCSSQLEYFEHSGSATTS